MKKKKKKKDQTWTQAMHSIAGIFFHALLLMFIIPYKVIWVECLASDLWQRNFGCVKVAVRAPGQ